MRLHPRNVQLALSVLSLALLPGCPPAGNKGPARPPVDDSPISVVIERVNRNSVKMNFMLRAIPATARGQWQVKPGEVRQFDMPAKLVFRRPRDLYLSMEHTFGQMEVGSNDTEFWVWLKGDENRYWWGEHQFMDAAAETSMPVRPDHLAEVLGLGDLPTKTTGPLGPVPWIAGDYYELNFLACGEGDQLRYLKAIDIDRRPPFLVCAIAYFGPDYTPVLRANLRDYRPIEGSDVLAPRRIHMKWLKNDDWLELEFHRMEAAGEEQAAVATRKLIARSPRQRGADLGLVERVDRVGTMMPPPASLPAAPQGGIGQP